MNKEIENEKMKDIFDFYRKNILIAYQGVFDKTVLSVMAKNIEGTLKNTKLSRKVFRVFVELAQNISYYSCEREVHQGRSSGSGIIVLQEEDNHFVFAAGNRIETSRTKGLERICEIVNSLDRDGRKEYKRFQLESPENPHPGLTQVALLSAGKVNHRIIKFDEEASFIIFAVKLKI